MKENELLTNEAMRNELAEHYEVLEKVKNLLIHTEGATLNQVADFYEVSTEAVKKIYQRNKEEIDMDGVGVKSYNYFITGQKCTIIKQRGSVIITYENGEELKVPMRGINVFPRRAILRIGMLLTGSKVAKQVREQLLNIEEKTSNETKVQDINEEQSLLLGIGMAYASGNPESIMLATQKLDQFRQRHIKKLEEDNKALAEGNLEWSNRSKLNAGIRKLATVRKQAFKDTWNELYKNLYYNHHINLKARGKAPFIQYIKEEEWTAVVKTFAAMCKLDGYSVSDMIDCKIKKRFPQETSN